jgi:pantetheine-phosphate adenylyltransferase
VPRAICPGSFDPVTRGHLDVIGRAAAVFDEVVVAVGHNERKNALFRPDERVSMLAEACAPWPGVSVTLFGGLLVDFCVEHDISAIVKGVRSASDVDYELAMAQMNRHLTGVDTILLPTAPQWSFVSSSLVREVALLGGDVTGLLPPGVAERTVQRIRERTG